MGPTVIYREDESRTLAMTTKFLAAYFLIIGSLSALILSLGAPLWLVCLAAGCLVGGIPAIAMLSRRDPQPPGKQQHPPPKRSFIVPLESPPPPRNFEGRTRELKQIRDLVSTWSADRPAIVNITGLAGIGKTALAAQFAYLNQDLFPGGQLFASLDDAADRDSLTRSTLTRFLAALQIIGEQTVENTVADQSQRYATLTRNLKLLVILDDASDPECVRLLLPSGAKCTVIVTSEEPLRELHPDLPLPLFPLSGTESIRLLESAVGRQRAQAHSEAARRLVGAGHPRAIELAATVLTNRPYSSLDQVMTRKAGRMKSAAAQDALAQELYLAIELLSAAERDALPYIAMLDEPVFESWELAALLDIREPDALRLCEHLSLTGVIKRDSVGPAGVVEFVVDDHIWQYLRVKMAGKVPPDKQAARRRALEAKRKVRGGRPATVYRLNETIQELRDAGSIAEAIEASREAVAGAKRSGDRDAEALALATLADLHATIGNIQEAYELADAACWVRDAPAPARALRCLGRVARRLGELDESAKKLEEAFTAAQQSDDPAEQVRILREKAVTLANTDNPASGVAVADEAITLWRDHRLGGSAVWASLLAGASFARGYALLACGRLQEASDCLTEAVKSASEDQALWLAWMAWLRGRLAVTLGQERIAVDACTEAIERFSVMSLRYGDGTARLLLSGVYARADGKRLDEAIALASDAVDTFQNCGDRLAEAGAKRLLSSYLRQRGNELGGADDLAEAARISEALGDDVDVAEIERELVSVRSGPAEANRTSSSRRRR